MCRARPRRRALELSCQLHGAPSACGRQDKADREKNENKIIKIKSIKIYLHCSGKDEVYSEQQKEFFQGLPSFSICKTSFYTFCYSAVPVLSSFFPFLSCRSVAFAGWFPERVKRSLPALRAKPAQHQLFLEEVKNGFSLSSNSAKIAEDQHRNI